jgi:hypothetical protein
MRIISGTSMEWPFVYSFPVELEFRSVAFCGARKIGDPREKQSMQGQEPTKQLNHI